jgi:hypothetical protein
VPGLHEPCEAQTLRVCMMLKSAGPGMVRACLQLRAAGAGVAPASCPAAAGREVLLHRSTLPTAQKELDSGASAWAPSAGSCTAPLPGCPVCSQRALWALVPSCLAWWFLCGAAGCRAWWFSCGAACQGEPPARRYVGTEGVYTHTVAYERDAACAMCSAGVPFRGAPPTRCSRCAAAARASEM